MKVLICGGEGQLAREFVIFLREHYPAIQVYALSHRELDVRFPKSVEAAFQRMQPHMVINTAAYHKVDECESNIARAFETNAWGGYTVAKASKEMGVRSMYISTGYVFDGEKEEPYEENDEVNPHSIYGHSKALAEKLILSADPSALIVRTNGLFGRHAGKKAKGGAGNFIDFVMQKAQAGENLTMVADQRITSTSTADLVPACLSLMLERRNGGIFHLTNSGEATWFDIAVKIYKKVGSSGKIFPITTAERNAPAMRPRNALLANTRWISLGMPALPSWEDALERYMAMK